MYNGLNNEKQSGVLEKFMTRDIIHSFCLYFQSFVCRFLPMNHIISQIFQKQLLMITIISFPDLPLFCIYQLFLEHMISRQTHHTDSLKLYVCLKLLLRLNIPKQLDQPCEICEIFVVHYLNSVILILSSEFEFTFVFLFIDFVFNLS